MMITKRTLKTACKSLKSLFKSFFVCAIVVSIGACVGCSIKASAPVEVVNAEIAMTTMTETQTERIETRPAFLDLGEFELTAYCPCSECCGSSADGITATGTKPVQGRTIAVDIDVIPYGYEVIINGHTYIAEDCGGAIVGKRIDIYFDSHSEALEFGRQTANVLLKLKETEC